jgi:hypothetical protein
MRRIAVATCLLATLVACSAAEPQAASPSPAHTPSVAGQSPSSEPVPTYEERVADPGAILSGARVRRTKDGFVVVAAWIVQRAGGRTRTVIATSDDGFRTATYERYSHDAYYELIPYDEPPGPGPDPDGMLSQPVTSLRAGTLGYVLGGDGATLFPFERTARSTDEGRTWTTYEVTEVHGERAYTSGEVILPNGRLLVNLTNWSGDKAGRPSKVHHGMWLSEGDDWSSFAPYEPPFSPPVDQDPLEWPAYLSLGTTTSAAGSVIWTSSPAGLLYVSTDGGVTFTQIPARPQA